MGWTGRSHPVLLEELPYFADLAGLAAALQLLFLRTSSVKRVSSKEGWHAPKKCCMAHAGQGVDDYIGLEFLRLPCLKELQWAELKVIVLGKGQPPHPTACQPITRRSWSPGCRHSTSHSMP